VSSFGTNGFVETDVEPNAIDRIQRIVPLPTRDGRLVVVGSTGVGAVRVVVARYTLDGALDPAFGGTGIVTTSIPGTTAAVPTDALRAPDGAIVVDGKACGAGTCTGFLARYLADGRLDPAFGDGGIAVADLLIAAIAMPDAGHVVATGKDADGFAVERFDLSTCGNGVVEPGEECDDGNTVDGDCCSAACRLDGNGSPCASDGDACTADVCRGAACTHVVPVDAGCATGGASLVVAAGTGATDHRLRLKWTSNGVVGAAAFGDPTRDATPTLCLVDVPSSDGGPVGGPGLVASVDAPAGSRCGAAPCWNETPTGFVYRDAGRRHDGIASLKLASKAGQGRIVLKAKGAPVDVPSLAAGDRLLVRLVRDDAPGCFEAVVDPTAATAGRLVAQTR
jgi:uncharacterized delta-60 repeat protein